MSDRAAAGCGGSEKGHRKWPRAESNGKPIVSSPFVSLIGYANGMKGSARSHIVTAAPGPANALRYARER